MAMKNTSFGRRGKAPAVSNADSVTDMKTFETLPEKTKTLARLQEDTVKTTGPEALVVQKKMKTQGEPPKSSHPLPGL